MISRARILSAMVLAALPGLLCAQPLPQPAVRPGPFEVNTVNSLNLSDLHRKKDVTVKVYYPRGAGPFPVIAFSHGLGGNKDAFSTVAQHWASHGYVVVAPTHDDRGVTMGAGGMSPPAEKVVERVADVTFVLDSLEQIAATKTGEVPANLSPLSGVLRGVVDASRMGVAGHSYGSFITMLAGGVTADTGSVKNASFADSRVQCIVPIAPAGRGDYGLTDNSWEDLRLPMMVFTGSRDVRSGRPAEWRQEPFTLSREGNKYLIHIEGATHGSYGADTDASNASAYVKAATVPFWNSCLKGDSAARYLLSPDGFRAFAGNGASLLSK